MPVSCEVYAHNLQCVLCYDMLPLSDPVSQQIINLGAVFEDKRIGISSEQMWNVINSFIIFMCLTQ